MSFVRVVGCDRCRFAGVYGLGCFDWGGYLLGGKQYWAVHFMTCVRCGLAHCFGQDHFETEPSDLYAQGGRLFLVAEIVEYLDHRGECFEEERDFLKLSEWVPCHQDLARRRPHSFEKSGEPRYSQEFACSACLRPETLLTHLGREARLACPHCGERSLGESNAAVIQPKESNGFLRWNSSRRRG